MERLDTRAGHGNGQPLAAEGLDSLYLTDLKRNPLRKPYGPVESGQAVIVDLGGGAVRHRGGRPRSRVRRRLLFRRQ